MDERGKTIFRMSSIVIASLLVVSIVGVAASLLQTSVSIPNAGAVKAVGVGVYWDSTCTNRTTAFIWGTLTPGSSKAITIYVRNEGNVAATISKVVRNWIPSSAADYLTVSWNYANQTVGVNRIQQINLMLTVASNVGAMTSFSFDITITASG